MRILVCLGILAFAIGCGGTPSGTAIPADKIPPRPPKPAGAGDGAKSNAASNTSSSVAPGN